MAFDEPTDIPHTELSGAGNKPPNPYLAGIVFRRVADE